MYGQPPHFRPGGGVPQPSQQQIHLNPNFFPNPIPNLFLPQQNPNFLPHINPFLQVQHPNTFPPIPQQQNFPVQPNPNNNNNNNNNSTQFPQQHVQSQNEMVEKVDKAVMRARHDLLASNENVSAWRVSQAALLMVKAESWGRLGFQMQQVPSLNRLLVTEGKINAFIHCFVAVRRITSLYDLEVAICESEGIERFEELELGPLVRHPLAMHYFSMTSDFTEVYRITTEEIVSYLCEFLDTHKKKEVQVDKFLDFIAKNQSSSSREKLCVRIQDFGIYINHIKQARQSEDTVVEKCYEKMKLKSDKRGKKRPLFSAQKKQMDDHFTTLSQRMKTFSSANPQFCGKHIRFMSSSSEDDDNNVNEYDDNQDEKNTENDCSLLRPNVRSDRVNSCPYPSATEEMTRLGLKGEVDCSPCIPSGGVDTELSQRKRRCENMNATTSLPRKLSKRDKFDTDLKHKGSGNRGISDHLLSDESIRMFVTTWKEACRENNADEVLERMLQFYNTRKKRKVKELFTSYPFVGLLYAAVTCIKFGMWDNMYDTFQTVSEKGMDNKPFGSSDDYISIDVEPAKKDAAISAQKVLTHKYDVTAEEIVKKITGYFGDDILSYKNPSRENKFRFLRKLHKCEYWLNEQYSINEFDSLGYGEYFMFLEKYMHRLPHELQKCMMGEKCENVSLEAHLLPVQLNVLLSQALNSFSENEIINRQNICELLEKQFPLVSLKLANSNHVENFQEIIREKSCNLTSNCVLFSTALLRFNFMDDLSTPYKEKMEETNVLSCNTVTRDGKFAAFTTKDAIEVLLKAPMLTDLTLWSHWDLLFAPSLGSFVEWLLKEVNTKELLCLVTKGGKVIRIDHSATLDSFLKVFIRGSSFETAVEFLSLFALYGGEKNVPLSLLKCHAKQAFEVLINNYMEMELHSDKNNKAILNKAAPVMSRFILDCLSYLPIEFCRSAADVLIAGLQSFVRDIPSAMLTECKQIEQRLMLHELGMSLGIMEWVNDYHSFSSSATTGSSCLDIANFEYNSRPMIVQDVMDEHPSYSGQKLGSCERGCHDLNCKQVNGGANSTENLKRSSTLDSDPERVIESIRHEEFGLDQRLSATENRMLEKQHARLGRALHCLSQELYSQDSHFLLELPFTYSLLPHPIRKAGLAPLGLVGLVQNADDNIYSEDVEPTLTFILKEKGIIVLNNEQGFLANNIRALCDVGNSTKKGHSAGYIGKKGIGFKSVFRVTDAPEIHSNGFHIKFDITVGQIGFVLPTVVPPCDIDSYTRLASADAERMNQNSWNTCIVLPFRSNLLEGFGMNNILSMFSDLHPSLLLFLHRLQCIKFRNTIDDSFIVMRKEVIGDGIVKVALGNEKMTWFVVSRKLKADVIRSDVQTTEISIAFTLQETGEGGYAPLLNQQPVFAFLPLRTYGLKFILQGDFVLPSSREEVDGNSPWNQWLLSEFPDLFVSAERSFCDLPCYRESPGKAITAFMSFIPLLGEVHGFFSSLPRMIVSKLRMSNCLILEGDEKEWVPPCKVLRNWTDQARSLLPSSLLHEHLGLGFLNKEIVLSDSLARALGVEDYGPKILLRVISSLCHSDNCLKSMGLSWLSSWLSAFYMMSSLSSMQSSTSFRTDSDFIFNLQKIPFIPLSDGTCGSLDEDTIWLHAEAVGQGIGISDECLLKAFPKLYSKLRIVSPNLLAAAASIESSCSDTTIVENVTRMLYKVGVQRLSVHDIVKVQILPAISDDKNATGQEELMIEYLAFAMFHLQSSCTACSIERGGIIAELHGKALILTNYGYKRSNEVPIHFNRDYGNPVDVNKLISGLEMKWHEIDTAYVKHPITKSISDGVLKWRNFFQEIGVTDFVQVIQVEKSVPETCLVNSKDVMCGKDTLSTDSVAKNWESEELCHLLICLSLRDDGEKSKYLLEILDRLWDDYFRDKVTGYCIDSTGERKQFKSSLIVILQDFSWLVSNINNKLHYPKDLFHNCMAVTSVLGGNAPYTIPKVSLIIITEDFFFQQCFYSFQVRSEKLVADIGLKTQVSLDDALSVLRLWRRSESPFKASVTQMSNFYAYLWKAMAISKKKVIEELHSGPFIFVPYTSSCSHEDVVPGALLSPQDVYWHDGIASIDQMKSVHPECVTSIASSPHGKMLSNFFQNLHDFFVNECGVDERPPLCSYLQILLQLSTIALPHQAAKKVVEVLLMWGDALKSGSLSFEDVEYLKESLLKKEYTVLPTRHDKWVSLHASFGLICWCDDDNLGREFGHLEGVDFLYFGESTEEENQMLRAKVSTIMQSLGIPALSKIVTREAIYYGPADSSFIFSLVNWVLPYAQRYLYTSHPDEYFQLKESGFENLRQLKIIVVEKLFYRNVIKRCEITSKKRHDCNCLLQDNILYCSQGSNPHSIFLELSCLLYNGTPALHFANFLHMITTMAESGATEDQTEFFILNSQKVPKLPAHEPSWSSFQSSTVNNYWMIYKKNYSNDWKISHGFSSVTTPEGTFAANNIEKANILPTEMISSELNLEVDPTVIVDAEISESKPNVMTNMVLDCGVDDDDSNKFVPSKISSSEREEVFAQQAQLTGRLGELVAYKYFVGEVGEGFVKWVNEANETGLPYDIILGDGDDNSREYVEVKATKSARKNWFLISMREWQFAVEKGESFSIAHVNIADENMARVTVYKNPSRLCQLGNLRLALVVPKQS
ncbi:hypothetical protein BUALT_Bualt09G0016500 [Buddleja alternifolia]|uniref:Protein NO VEIN C-terminal domain-containing protein n=1 Tax=Buddleja alternifolia TaxID=168488 RepID=A0AAV6XA15_9LAMI|nr:hypothetical protein BUALT_Bualt09G0016500 [Buddleja alternifolia]